MNKKTDKKKRPILEVSSIIISILALIISLIAFIFPLTNSRIIVEDPGNIYFTSDQNSDYDVLIIPLLFNNYGPFVRTISQIEATISYKNFMIPIKPYFEYDKINKKVDEINPLLYSTFVIHPNDGVKKIIGFKFDKTNFTQIDMIPNSFHFEPNAEYVINMRFYTTQNSFFGNKKVVIQVIYGFSTNEIISQGNEINVSKRTFFTIVDTNKFDR